MSFANVAFTIWFCRSRTFIYGELTSRAWIIRYLEFVSTPSLSSASELILHESVGCRAAHLMVHLKWNIRVALTEFIFIKRTTRSKLASFQIGTEVPIGYLIPVTSFAFWVILYLLPDIHTSILLGLYNVPLGFAQWTWGLPSSQVVTVKYPCLAMWVHKANRGSYFTPVAHGP